MTDIAELKKRCAGSYLSNDDLLPTKQTWNWYNIFAFWMSDVHSAGGYVFAGTLFSLGLSGWQVFVSLIVGILIVQVLANTIGRASQRYAVPFPVISRMTFGVIGSNLSSLTRGIIAIVWYGIQTYLASSALLVTVLYFYPSLAPYAEDSILGLSTLGWWCFVIMWLFQTALFLMKMDFIKRFIDWAGPAVYVVMVVLMFYIIYKAGWSNISFTLHDKELTAGESFWQVIVGISLIVSYFAGPTLNYGDFSQYCKSIDDMKRGNFWGLPINFVFFSSIAVITISGTPAVFGKMLIDPIHVMGYLDTPLVVLLMGFTLFVATIGVNIVANFVSAAFDISNVFPKVITWRRGGLIAAVVSVMILPWNLFNSPETIHYTIDVLAGLLGPLYGVIIVDYYLIKKQHIDVISLYDPTPQGIYWYTKRVHLTAVGSVLFGGAISAVVFLSPDTWGVSNFSFFIGMFAATGMYMLLNAKTIFGDK